MQDGEADPRSCVEVTDLILWLATRPPGGSTGHRFSLARRSL
jgi:hypothetical protein